MKSIFHFIKKEEVLVNTLLINIAKRLITTGSILSVILLSGCASYPLLSDMDVPVSNDYLIGPGDNVDIIVWRNPEISMSVPVRPDGKITTPLVEDLPASGKTSTQLARDIEETLSKYVQQPVVTVVVTEFVGPFSEQIRVIGEAAQPQALAYRENMTLMDVLIAVGGITDFAAGNRARIIRTIDGEQQQFSVRLNDLIRDGDISANVPMIQGDVLVIPESFF
ncbi:MAG: polysaccharide export protein [Betaproteobacteria bacterium]|nr:polysaccharide export protein [Betaproteobacteria bacterium]